ncbi:hypothetical protein BAUCODRAFT_286024 [Baudoinia panamericana UAMH 10762]|uniref:Uncharacterized protein n=1 Tax=Baudoinia panamericana (strain UAMH 10762) TaxID=717646 RepID=M2M7P2_BAUPA|nr:uncharacterized protein BAUCODRAFT_286024 [Baudoinia panamericana UAMH 10762]EMC92346.1 hypothetical protein BAUCODRAFT_286024 [Baudoinia panamericana UAMH 10762]
MSSVQVVVEQWTCSLGGQSDTAYQPTTLCRACDGGYSGVHSSMQYARGQLKLCCRRQSEPETALETESMQEGVVWSAQKAHYSPVTEVTVAICTGCE